MLPVVSGETIPDNDPIVATEGLLLVQVPPPASVKVAVDPIHIVVGPDIAPGAETTLTVVITKQPEGKV